ncbi:MAG: DUF4328 domain-containing protein [Acidobacteriota bacterium]|nr:DUF4328 domain-containing protein [Acidobacteriota bacterium]
MAETQDTYVNLSGITRLLRFALWVGIVLAVVNTGSDLLEIQLLEKVAAGGGITDEEADVNDMRQLLLGGVAFVVFLVTAVVFLRWIYIAKRNARSFHPGELKYTPGWSVGWFFIPFANLWKPYDALKETFQASDPEYTDNWRAADPPSLLPFWWALWLLSGLVGQILFRWSMKADSLDELIYTDWVQIVSNGLDVILILVVLSLIGKLSGYQGRTFRKLEAQARARESAQENALTAEGGLSGAGEASITPV